MGEIQVGADATGRACPYCRFPLKAGTNAHQCDECGALHHQDCWRDGAGCAVLGCAAAGTGATDATVVQRAQPLPPPAGYPPAPPVPQGFAGPPPGGRGTSTGVLAGLVVALALVVLGGGAFLLLAGEDKPSVADTTTVTVPEQSTDPQTSESTPDPAAVEADLAREIEAIVAYSQAGRTAVRSGRYDDAISNRQEVLSRLDAVSGTTGRLAAAKRQLRAAMEASLASDEAYANGGNPTATDAAATRLKRSFVRIWNPIAAEHGLRQYDESGV